MLFLTGAFWPAEDDAYGNAGDPGARYVESMRHCWLSSPWRHGELPDGSASAAELWELHGEQVTAEWIARAPGTRPAAFWRFAAQVCPEPDDDEFECLKRHNLLTQGELRPLRTGAHRL